MAETGINIESPATLQFRLSYLFYVMAFIAAGLAVSPGTVLLSLVWLFVCYSMLRYPTRQEALGGLSTGLTLGMLFLLFMVPMARRGSFSGMGEHFCQDNIRTLVSAMEAYEQKEGRYPFAQVNDDQGKPMHSWRVLLLPQLGENDLYGRYDFEEPWDGPNNRMLVDEMPSVFRCPSHRHSGRTHYKLVNGHGTLFDGKEPKLTPLHEIESTAFLVEDWRRPVNWMKPEDISISSAVALFSNMKKNGSAHDLESWFTKRSRRSNFGMLSGKVLRLGGNSDPAVWVKLFGVNNGEVDMGRFDEVGEMRYRIDRIVSAAIYLLLGLLPFVQAWRKPSVEVLE